MDGIAASSMRMKGGLRATLSCVCSTPEKSFEPFEPYLHSAMVQARFKGSKGGSRVRNISERPRLYCPQRQGYAEWQLEPNG